MEELLNKLIEKGWKPRWEEEIKSCQIWESFYKRKFIEDTVWFYEDDRWTPQWLFSKSLREVCSKSSWLWQFVCENGMVGDKWEIRYKADENNDIDDANYMSEFYYWLLESALKDESELEQLLLDNIKVE